MMSGKSVAHAAHSMHQWTAVEITSAIENGRTTCEAVTRACLERIAEREPKVQAWEFLDPELAIAQARALDKRGLSG
ncbi:MAG: hypothetical protein ACXWCS_04050, partial [Burkholderiales bacterium]